MATKGLFSYYILVRLQPSEESEDGVEAVIDYRYPPGELPKSDKTLMGLLTQFCFPDKEKFPKLTLSSKNKKFTFVVTNIEGVKRFGYCRRELVGDIWQGKRWAVCHCILSLSPCHPVFEQILEAGCRLASKDLLEPFCKELEHQAIPLPGDNITLTLTTNAETGQQTTLRFVRPTDDQSLSGFANFSVLLEYLDPFTILMVLSSLLLERRVIFVSSKLSVLSSCVQGFVALLYPFVWQHVFIPVLPLGMLQFVCAPVPFVVGLLQHHLPELEKFSDVMEEVLLVDIDNSNVLPPTDDYRMLPDDLVQSFNTAAHLAIRALKKSGKKKDKSESKGSDRDSDDNPADSSATQLLELGCVDFLAQIMGPYKMFLTKDSFDKEGFVKNQKEFEKFRDSLVGSQLFEQFIVQRQATLIADRTTGGRFERRLTVRRTLHLGAVSNPAQIISLKSDLGLSDADSANDPLVAAMNVSMDDVIMRTGWLNKFGKGLKGHWAASRGQDTTDVGTWQARYFKLTWTKLAYYRYRADSLPAGAIELNEVYAATMIDSHKGRENVLEVKTPERIYYLHSGNPADLANWYNALQFRVRDNHYQSASAAAQLKEQAYQQQLAQAQAQAHQLGERNVSAGKTIRQFISGVRGGVASRNEDDGSSPTGSDNSGKKKGLASKIKGFISNKKGTSDDSIVSSKSTSSLNTPSSPGSSRPVRPTREGTPTSPYASSTLRPNRSAESSPAEEAYHRRLTEAAALPQPRSPAVTMPTLTPTRGKVPTTRPRGLSRDDSSIPSPNAGNAARTWQASRPVTGNMKNAVPDQDPAFLPPSVENRAQFNARRFAVEFQQGTPEQKASYRRETMYVQSSSSSSGMSPPNFSTNSSAALGSSPANRAAARSMRIDASSSDNLAAEIQRQLREMHEHESKSQPALPPKPTSSAPQQAQPSGLKRAPSRPRSVVLSPANESVKLEVDGMVSKLQAMFEGDGKAN